MSPSPTDLPGVSEGNGHLEVAPPLPPRRRHRSSGAGITRAELGWTALIASVLGGATATGLLFALGAVQATRGPTNVVEQTIATSGRSGALSTLNARDVYASSAAGVVDITAQNVNTGGGQGNPFAPPGQSQSTASGTGSVIDGRGHVLTSAHVVDGASSVNVTFQDGTVRSARLLGEDLSSDVAVLKVDPSGLTLHPLALGSSRSLAVGDALAVVGDPFQFDRSLSTGVVSGLDRTIQTPNGFSVAHAIQTDAALNPGNSGGPVLDAHGRLVGIADQIATGGSGAQSSTGVGFAVPIDMVRPELRQLEHGSAIRHAYLGVSTAQATTQEGALVASVQPGTPAAAAGLRSGDVIVGIDGSVVKGSNDVVSAISAHRPGDRVTLTVQRGSSTRKLTVALGRQPGQAPSG